MIYIYITGYINIYQVKYIKIEREETMKKLFTLLTAGIFALSAVGCGTSEATSSDEAIAAESETNADEALKLLFYTPGTLGDMGIIDQAWRASQAVEEKYGMELTVVENGSVKDTLTTAFVDAMELGDYDIAIAGASYVVDVIKERSDSGEWADTTFILYDTSPLTEIDDYDNIIGLGFKQNECSFLAAVYQCMMTKTGRIGELAGADNPIQNDFMTGWITGVKWYNDNYDADIEYNVAYRGAATLDATYETANTLYNAGCDIVYNVAGSATLATCQACEEHGGWENGYGLLGVDLDQYTFYKNSEADAMGYENILTSGLKNVEDMIQWAADEYMEGTLVGGNYALGIADGAVTLSYNERYYEVTPEDVQAAMEEIEEKIINGEIVVPRYFDFEGGFDEFAAYRDDPDARI